MSNRQKNSYQEKIEKRTKNIQDALAKEIEEFNRFRPTKVSLLVHGYIKQKLNPINEINSESVSKANS